MSVKAQCGGATHHSPAKQLFLGVLCLRFTKNPLNLHTTASECKPQGLPSTIKRNEMSVTKTRQKLVDVARQLFAQNGLEATTMNMIAVASQKGRRTLYTYFKNKEEIFSEFQYKQLCFRHGGQPEFF